MRELLEKFMRIAVRQAKQSWGMTHPDPMEGAVIVEHGEVVSEGYRVQGGSASALEMCLDRLGRRADNGANLFLTMEPSTVKVMGTSALDTVLESGINRIILGTKHPNLGQRGKGIEALEKAGRKVIFGILEEECSGMNLLFNHWSRSGNPLITAKLATTLDGKLGTRTGLSQWITSETAREDVMHWRRLFPSIAVGAMTVEADDPKLTSRRLGYEEWSPIRFVFDGRLRLAEAPLKGLFTDQFKNKTTVVTVESADSDRVKLLKDNGVDVWQLESTNESVPFDKFREKCKREKVLGVMFEGGAHLISRLLVLREIDYLFAYQAPKIMGDNEALTAFQGRECLKMTDLLGLREIYNKQLGDDHLVRGYLDYPEEEKPKL